MIREHGIPVWYSDTNIRGAQQWHDEIGAALRRCDWFVVVLTPDAVESRWVKRELLFSLQQDRFDGRIAPILYRSCNHDELSWTLASLQMVDFREDFDQGCRDLLRIWASATRLVSDCTPSPRGVVSRGRGSPHPVLPLGDAPSGPGSIAFGDQAPSGVLSLAGDDPCRGDRQSLLNTLHTFTRRSAR